MARYRLIAPKYWMECRKRGWTDDMMLLGAWLQTCDYRSNEGLFYLPVENVAGGLGWDVGKAARTLAELEENGWCTRDGSALFIWIPSVFDLTHPKGEKQIAGALTALEDIPGSSEMMPLLYARAVERCPEFATALVERWPVLASGTNTSGEYPSDGVSDPVSAPHRYNTTTTTTTTKACARGARELSPAPKFNRKPIPKARLEVAEQLLADFNDRFGVEIRGWTSDGKLTEDLRVIVGALTADDRIDRDVGARMHEIVDRGDHYWSGRAHPGLVYGERVRGRVAEAALAAPSETSERDRRHRKWELQRIASDLGSGVITDEVAEQKRADVDRRYPAHALRPSRGSETIGSRQLLISNAEPASGGANGQCGDIRAARLTGTEAAA